ncbi:MAG: nucleotidyltransferase family protein [Chloroflexi bacterium]|nr:nucleotidyltransferase family protein [Chloroflexota bacterium]
MVSGAGAVAQAVWNDAHGFVPTYGIGDYDLVYFERADPSEPAERRAETSARSILADLGVTLDVTSEARVHEWYPQRFGRTIAPYRSTKDAIATWPTTATSIGVRRERSGQVTFCAPFGLDDLLALVVRPNKAIVARDVFEAKVGR